jgi:UDP-glucose 4-epimerase
MSRNVLITGHRGYIGSALYNKLLGSGIIDNVIGYDIVEGHDIMDYDTLVDIMKREDINMVIHLAAMSTVTECNSDPNKAMKVNCGGTANVVRAMQTVGCPHIIYASTSSVYGNDSCTPYTEHRTVRPCSPYGRSKLWGEMAIQNVYDLENYEGNYLIYRMFNVVGTSGDRSLDQQTYSAADRLFGALSSGKVTIYGTDYSTKDGTCERDYVALKDVVLAYMLGIETLYDRDRLRQVVNIGSGISISVQEVVDIWNLLAQVDQIANNVKSVHVTYGERRSGDPDRVVACIKRAKKVLRWIPERKIETIIGDIGSDRATLTH